MNTQNLTDAQFEALSGQVITRPVFNESVNNEFLEAVRRRSGLSAPAPAAVASPPLSTPTNTNHNPFANDNGHTNGNSTNTSVDFFEQQQQAAPAPAPAPSTMDLAKQQMTEDQIDAHKLVISIRRYLKTKGQQPTTIGELSEQIKNLTALSWGGYWQKKHGELVNFLKLYPDSFVVIKNKYVTLPGQEDIALRQLEKDAAAAAALKPATATTSLPPTAQTNNIPKSNIPIGVALSMQQAQQQQTYNPMGYQYPPPTQQYQPQPSLYPNPFETQQQFFQPNPYAMQQQQQPFFPGSDPFFGGNSTMAQPNPFATPPLPPTTGINHRDSSVDWMLRTDAGAYDAFGLDSKRNSFSATANAATTFVDSSDSGWAVLGTADPWATTASPSVKTSTAEEEAAEKARRKEAKAKKKEQEKLDEDLARKMQQEEYQAAGAIQSEWVTLTTPEMRDLAEKELGRDNVKIIAGFTVKKIGREGKPHQRKMWITSSLTHLAWSSSLLDGSHRGVELRQVSEVLIGEMTSTIARSMSDKTKVRALCFSLVTSNRTLDLQACSVIQRDTLVAALKQVIEFNKKYRPQKVDRYHTKVMMIHDYPNSAAATSEKKD